MTRLKNTFKKLHENNKKAFSVFLMSGYPNDDIFVELLDVSAKSGADFIEVGMPFSDPSADGPTIRLSGTYSLNNGTTVEKTISSIKKFRKINNSTPIVWMGYFNSIFNYGIDKFIQNIIDAGVDGLLIVDLPAEETYRLNDIKNKDIDLIRLITPTTTKERIAKILSDASGFIYYVSIKGITGTKEACVDDMFKNIEYIKSQTDIPVVAGFGITNPTKAKQICKFTDGAIVGSALTKIIKENIDTNNQFNKNLILKSAGEFIASFK